MLTVRLSGLTSINSTSAVGLTSPYNGGTHTAKSTRYLFKGLLGDESCDSLVSLWDVLLFLLLRRRKSTGCSMLRGRSQYDVTTDTACSNVGRSVTSSMTSSSSLGTGSGSSQISMTGIALYKQSYTIQDIIMKTPIGEAPPTLGQKTRNRLTWPRW